MKAPTPTAKEKLKERLANGKPQIISSFLKDCLEADEVTEEVSFYVALCPKSSSVDRYFN